MDAASAYTKCLGANEKSQTTSLRVRRWLALTVLAAGADSVRVSVALASDETSAESAGILEHLGSAVPGAGLFPLCISGGQLTALTGTLINDVANASVSPFFCALLARNDAAAVPGMQADGCLMQRPPRPAATFCEPNHNTTSAECRLYHPCSLCAAVCYFAEEACCPTARGHTS